MHYKDFTAHAEFKAQRIGVTDPNAWRHLCASRHVKAEPQAERDRAYLARRKRRETLRAVAGAVGIVLASAAVVGVFALWVVVTFAGAAA